MGNFQLAGRLGTFGAVEALVAMVSDCCPTKTFTGLAVACGLGPVETDWGNCKAVSSEGLGDKDRVRGVVTLPPGRIQSPSNVL